MRWFLLLIISASAVWAQFPLPMPTRPTSFPLERPDVQGGVVRWGNWSYSSAPPESHTNIVAISGGGYHDLSVTASGQVIAWKPPGMGGTVDDAVRVPADLSDVVAVAAGTYFSLALKQDGRVVGWGYNAFGQRSVPSNITNAVAIGAGDSYSVALLANGQLAGWGNANNNSLAFPAAATNVVALSVGGGHGLALTAQGTVLAWGRNDYGQASVPAGLSNVVQIYAGWTHSLALKSDGSIAGWGANDYGQAVAPAGLTNAVAVSGGDTHSVAIRADGGLTAWGLNHNGQTNAPQGITSAIAVSTRQDNSIVLFANTYPVLSVRNEFGAPIQTNAHVNLTSVVGQTSAPTSLSLRNVGNATLLLSDIRLEGSAAGEYSLGTTAQSLAPNESSVLELLFSPISSGSRNASLIIESSDPNAPSFTINLDGKGLSYDSDTDGDGMNDAAEFLLQVFGFDWQMAQPSLVSELLVNAPAAGLYSSNNVVTNAALFGLFTQAQFNGNRAAGQQDVIASPMTYGLYDSNSIMDLRMGGLMIQKQGTSATVFFQPQTTTDLTSVPFADSGPPITKTFEMPGNKGFLRVQALATAPDQMITVQGGTLPQSSQLAGTVVETFRIGKYEVTWGEWHRVKAWAASRGYDFDTWDVPDPDTYPVRRITWNDAAKFCNAKSEMEQLQPVYQAGGETYKSGWADPTVNQAANGYRLPSEAEWEWAARGGVNSLNYTYSGGNDIGNVAWYSDNHAGLGPRPGGQKSANELGIHDMSGNLYEFTQDPVIGGSFRRSRGGSWLVGADMCEVGNRFDFPDYGFGHIGFRLARNAQ